MQDWHVDNQGKIVAGASGDDFELPEEEYRLYRFLTEVEDLLRQDPEDGVFVRQLAPMVRRLLMSSYWLQGSYSEPDPKKGWSVDFLYDEPGFPLTIQMVAWKPGSVSPIHNHAAWGLVAFIEGMEKNTFWRETEAGIETIGEQIFEMGDIVTFEPQAIHHIEALGEETIVSFNIYGKTDYKNRYRFNAETGTKEKF